MKSLLIFFIRIYQKVPIKTHNMCRFNPTCSEYAIGCLEEYGLLRGSFMAFKRILRCNPFSKSKYDPVPKKEL